VKNIFLILVVLQFSVYAQESVWDKVKSGSNSAWESTKSTVSSIRGDDVKENVGDGYDNTKKIIADKAKPSIWDKTKDLGSKTWDTTKEYSGRAWDKSKETYNNLTEDKK